MTVGTIGTWECAAAEAASVATPRDLDALDGEWSEAAVPGTAAAAMARAGRLPQGTAAADYLERNDFWFRTAVTTQTPRTALRFEGVATVCEIYVDGIPSASNRNMFTPIDVVLDEPGRHEVVMVCRSLTSIDVPRSPRARWRTHLVVGQHLRWFRTSLFGRMPGWTPPVPAVGPWRPVRLIEARGWVVERRRMVTSFGAGVGGTLAADLVVAPRGAGPDASSGPVAAQLVVGSRRCDLTVTGLGDSGAARLSGVLAAPDARPWFPATHGEAALDSCSVEIAERSGSTESISLGRIGFRTVVASGRDGGYALSVNGVDVFCRGASWMPIDPLGHVVTRDRLAAELRRLVRAGVNMVRVPGTTTYECDDFYDLCDELGILVWQDVMLANFDYPIADDGFRNELDVEVETLAERLSTRPSVAVICGGSEVEQQAAMMGLPRETWQTELGHEVLARWVAERFPGSVYVTGSPSGRPFPFSPGFDVGHYYGVGAYLRPFEDARRTSVRFASECLAFAGVAESRTVAVDFPELSIDGPPGNRGRGDVQKAIDWTRWDEAVARDRDASWDFQDVRDHYVGIVFGCDAAALRQTDPARYLELGRASVYVAIHSTFSEWRRAGSSCRGGLVWMLRDVRPGAGWGIVDHIGAPKSGFYALADVSGPRAVLLTDEGLNGLWAHVVNDSSDDLMATVVVRMFAADGRVLDTGTTPVTVPSRSGRSLCVDEIFGGFRDLTYAYRFGGSLTDVVDVELVDADEATIHSAHFLPSGQARRREDIGLDAQILASTSDAPVEAVDVVVRTAQFAQFVSLDLEDGWSADNGWFHLPAGAHRTVRCRPPPHVEPLPTFTSGVVRAVNALTSSPLRPA